MFESFIGERVIVDVSTGGEKLLEYMGVLSSESEDTIVLTNLDIYYLTKVFNANCWTNEKLQKYRSNMSKVIINKKYIISCEK